MHVIPLLTTDRLYCFGAHCLFVFLLADICPDHIFTMPSFILKCNSLNDQHNKTFMKRTASTNVKVSENLNLSISIVSQIAGVVRVRSLTLSYLLDLDVIKNK